MIPPQSNLSFIQRFPISLFDINIFGLTELPLVSESLLEIGPVLEVVLKELPMLSEALPQDGPVLEVG